MIYPIVAYGDPILRKKSIAIEEGTDLEQLVGNMLSTMHHVHGVGLAAPQIGKSIRLFVVDFTPYLATSSNEMTCCKVLINPVLKIDATVAPSMYEEGCLSIPDVLVEVPRQEKMTIHYFDVKWKLHKEQWTGLPARIIQHEYDHLEGKLHIDYASSLKKRLLKNKLKAIRQGQVNVPYNMHFVS